MQPCVSVHQDGEESVGEQANGIRYQHQSIHRQTHHLTIHTYTHLCVPVYIHTHHLTIHTYTHLCVPDTISLYIHIHTYIYTLVCTCTRGWRKGCWYYIISYIGYLYIYTHHLTIHTYTHIHIHTSYTHLCVPVHEDGEKGVGNQVRAHPPVLQSSLVRFVDGVTHTHTHRNTYT